MRLITKIIFLNEIRHHGCNLTHDPVDGFHHRNTVSQNGFSIWNLEQKKACTDPINIKISGKLICISSFYSKRERIKGCPHKKGKIFPLLQEQPP